MKTQSLYLNLISAAVSYCAFDDASDREYYMTSLDQSIESAVLEIDNVLELRAVLGVFGQLGYNIKPINERIEALTTPPHVYNEALELLDFTSDGQLKAEEQLELVLPEEESGMDTPNLSQLFALHSA